MINSDDQGISMLPSITRNLQENLKQTHQKHGSNSTSLFQYFTHINPEPQITSKSINMKSERYNELKNSSKMEIKTLASLKRSLRKNLIPNKTESPQLLTHSQSRQFFQKEGKVKDPYTKNSLMNKLISQHKKANKINFQDTRSQLFVNFHKRTIYVNQNIKQNKNSEVKPNDKIQALLNDRPFKKTSPLKCNLGRLKMIQNIKELAKRNTLIYASFNQTNLSSSQNLSMGKETQRTPFTSNLKNNQSLESIQKPFIKTDLLKECMKSEKKHHKISSLQRSERPNKKKSILQISDDQRSQNNLETIRSVQSIESIRKMKVQKELQSQNCKQNRQKKCQQKIISDLVKLQQMRNRKSYAEHKILQLKSSRFYAQNFKQVKFLGKDQNQSKNQNTKYVVKFKTEPKQSQRQKLDAKICEMLPEIQVLRNKLLEETRFEDSLISGFAQTLKQRPLQMSERVLKGQTNERKSHKRKSQSNLVQKEVSGWDIEMQTQGRDHWNLNY